MGIILEDIEDEEFVFVVNFWNWRAIVEAVRRLDVLPDDRVDALHGEFGQTEVSRNEAHQIGTAIRERLVPSLGNDGRVLIDGKRTTEPEDPALDWSDFDKNYSTNRRVLDEFATYCLTCAGFVIL